MQSRSQVKFAQFLLLLKSWYCKWLFKGYYSYGNNFLNTSVQRK